MTFLLGIALGAALVLAIQGGIKFYRHAANQFDR
jgi:hypothetical protein